MRFMDTCHNHVWNNMHSCANAHAHQHILISEVSSQGQGSGSEQAHKGHLFIVSTLQKRVGGVWQQQSTQKQGKRGYKGKPQGKPPTPPAITDCVKHDMGVDKCCCCSCTPEHLSRVSLYALIMSDTFDQLISAQPPLVRHKYVIKANNAWQASGFVPPCQ